MPAMPLLLRTRRSVRDSSNNDTTPVSASGSDFSDREPSASRESRESPITNPLAAQAVSPLIARPASEQGLPRSSLSREVLPQDVTPEKDCSRRRKRFSMLKRQNYSESNLAIRATEFGARRPPMPALHASMSAVPSIVRTAPTFSHDSDAPQEETESQEETSMDATNDRQSAPRRDRRSIFRSNPSPKRSGDSLRTSLSRTREEKRTDKAPETSKWRKWHSKSTGLEDLQKLSSSRPGSKDKSSDVAKSPQEPSSHGGGENLTLSLPTLTTRTSESSRSDGSNGSDPVHASTNTNHPASTQNRFFSLPRRNKNRQSLFPLPIKIPPPNDAIGGSPTPRASTGAVPASSLDPSSAHASNPLATVQRRHTEESPTTIRRQQQDRALLPPLPGNSAVAKSSLSLAKNSLSFADPSMSDLRDEAQQSRPSSLSSPLHQPRRMSLRDRSSTNSSYGRKSHDMATPPILSGSGRNSSSTAGRPSFGGLLSFTRFRNGSESHSPRHGSPGAASKSNSFAESRDHVVPDREEGDTPGRYLERLLETLHCSVIAGILSKSADPFAQAVLRSYTRRFAFFGEPIDMSLRKFLLEAELPKETQQVDRVIQAFADRYHECNPGIFICTDQAYIIAFSLIMLHTDAFNKNNKRKMQKQDYIKNTSDQGVSDDVLGCYYDNICYTPFVHFEEDFDIHGERIMLSKPKKSKLKGAIVEGAGKKPAGPVDPYNLLVDQKLDTLRPPIRESITMDDPYNYRATQQGELDPQYIQRAFTHTGVLQIVSLRSRPTAYETQPSDAPASEPPQNLKVGIIDIQVTKVGTLWRKAPKKKTARSPWQEWGAILTGSQLYLFKNAHWAKGLAHQFNSAQQHARPRTPVVFKPPLQEFKPDALIKTDNAVALVDSTYTRHKNAFTLVRPGGHEEVLLADNESELHDWLAMINYAAAFRAAGVRIRGMVGEVQESSPAKAASSTIAPTINGGSEDKTKPNRGPNSKLQQQVMAARRNIMVKKIADSNRELAERNKELDRLLRNARHLLVLAPLAPRTREIVMHAAAQADASIKWTRRDIWRTRCRKDILTMDIRQDGLSAAEITALAEAHSNGSSSEPARRIESTETTGPAPETSASAPQKTPQPARSPPRGQKASSPSRDRSGDGREGSVPRRSQDAEFGDLRLAPFHLNVLHQETASSQRDAHESRESAANGTAIRSNSPPAPGTSSHTTSPASSIRQVPVRMLSGFSSATCASEGSSRRPSSPTVPDPEAELMARATMGIEDYGTMSASARNSRLNFDGSTGTPENKPRPSAQGGVRRSLQKTLRGEPPHHSPSLHRHRKNKESDGTVRSGGTGFSAETTEAEMAPGLTREKQNFMLHGKKASVVHFSGAEGWAGNVSERIKDRRAASHPSDTNCMGDVAPGDEVTTPTQNVWGPVANGRASPTVLEFDHTGTANMWDSKDDDASRSPKPRRPQRPQPETPVASPPISPASLRTQDELFGTPPSENGCARPSASSRDPDRASEASSSPLPSPHASPTRRQPARHHDTIDHASGPPHTHTHAPVAHSRGERTVVRASQSGEGTDFEDAKSIADEELVRVSRASKGSESDR